MNPDRSEELTRLWKTTKLEKIIQAEEAILQCIDDLERFLNQTALSQTS
jgi:hypothetical protein